jgi:PAS domain S-box-containing protein
MADEFEREGQRVPGLETAHKCLRLLVERVKGYAIFLLDPQGCVMTWNAGAEAMKGYQPHEIIGRHFSCFYEQNDVIRGKPDGLLAKAAREGHVEDEGWRVRKDGTRFWANVLITVLHDEEGQVSCFAKITRDLTEREQGRQLLEQRVQERTEELLASNAKLTETIKELEEFQQAVVGREFKIIALEKRVAELEAALRHATASTVASPPRVPSR